MEMQEGLSLLQCIFSRAEGAARESGLDREDHGGIGVADIPPSSRKVVGAVGLGKLILRGNNPILGLSAFGAPTAVRNARGDREVQPSPISTCLSSGDNFDQPMLHGLETTQSNRHQVS